MYSRSVTRRFRRTVLVIAVLPLVMLIGLRSAWAAYACSMDGEVRSSCCCPKQEKDDEAPRDGAPRIEASCCCEITTGESSLPPDARLTDSSRADDVSWIAVTVAPAPVRVWQLIAATERIAVARPPPPSLPTYLVNRTILL